MLYCRPLAEARVNGTANHPAKTRGSFLRMTDSAPSSDPDPSPGPMGRWMLPG